MPRLLLALLLMAPAALNAQDNPNYDPDYDGDGCYSVADILGLLPLFGSCVDTTPAFACGDSVLFDSYWYETVLIGDQCWFTENLRTTVYRNDVSIPEVLDSDSWTGLSMGARCDYNNDATSVDAFGRLYNWYAVNDARGLCPSGWHVPTDGEWTHLEDYISSQGFSGTEGTALKSNTGWDGTDDFGFSALPGGDRAHYNGSFYSAGLFGSWWSSSPNFESAWYRYLVSGNLVVYRTNNDPRYGYSVRCLRDAE